MEIKEKEAKNIWCTDTKNLFDIILKATQEEDFTWSWSRSDAFKCKYINIRLDMRDGGFILRNDKGDRLTADELWNQGLKDRKDVSSKEEESCQK